ncbi:FAD-binding protein [Glarea lozoyensis ATCC 20868]|uniref:FAD-binding protein n=1 Tax=Glarea lozoyensis (strain ATCC 20868 / MF5171) TaxID=1116229 RepID=S3D346_GLAL2|nr:FAD-binding protein [Glarea lozoyensis ATCC 20868]EPE32917.1 FAD-binding protein [Glarea lozoyensis ATCC 20868]
MRNHYLYPVIAAGIIYLYVSAKWTGKPFCRCRPNQSCWPSIDEWKSLNGSINGNLVRVKPIGAACREPDFNHDACIETLLLSRNSGWRASNPGALQDWVWESENFQNHNCSLDVNSGRRSCNQGRVPIYSAVVQSPQHVRKAVKFAKKHNLRLAIKSTGHDTSGRSSSPDSFQITTHLLKEIHVHRDFLATGASRTSGPAVSVGAGVLQSELYRKGSQEGFTIVGGECPTVAAVGGFLQGGGVSSLHSHTRGLAIDNVLEYQVVTAEGKQLIANEYQNKDVFWALRGGGGGTFGIVTQATLQVFPDDPTVISTLSISVQSLGNVSLVETNILGLLKILQRFNKEDIPGQFIQRRPSSTILEATLTLYFFNMTKTDIVERRIKGHWQTVFENDQTEATLSVRFQPKISSELRMVPDIYPENYGILSGSSLISSQLFESVQGPQIIARAFSELLMAPDDILFTSNLAGLVKASNGFLNTAIHPAWRSADHLINFVRAVEANTLGKKSAFEELSNVQMPILYSIEDPKSRVSYRNLGDPNEKNFQEVYWGKNNYERLLNIKSQIDPEDLFMTRLGVGSEGWDTDGMCRGKGLSQASWGPKWSGIFRVLQHPIRD